MNNQVDVRRLDNKSFKKLCGNRFFTCKFLTKENKVREYKSCRVNVKCDTKGGENTVEHKNNLVTVWLEENGQRKYRTLDLTKIIDFKCSNIGNKCYGE